MSSTRDPYKVLGVLPSASDEVIRRAYLAYVKILHPDQIDRDKYPNDWQRANTLLTEVNEAYSILRNPLLRSKYDESCRARQHYQNPQPPKTETRANTGYNSPWSNPSSSSTYQTNQRKANPEPTRTKSIREPIFLRIISIFEKLGCGGVLGIFMVVFVVGGIAVSSINEHAESKRKEEQQARLRKMEQPMPYSGKVRFLGSRDTGVAPLEIKAAHGSHFLLKLVDVYTGRDVLDVFVRSGSTVEIDVPLGKYWIRYASGETWYGYDMRFGPDTSYSKADKTFSFQLEGNSYSGHTITLYKVPHGNLHTSKINEKDF